MKKSQNNNSYPSYHRIADFYAVWFSRSWLALVILQIFLITILIFALLVFGQKYGFWETFAFAIIIFVFAESLFLYIFLRKILLPVDVVARSLSWIRGENSLLTPVDAGDPRFSRNGIGEILTMINQLANKKSNNKNIAKNLRDFEDGILRMLPVGFIAFDSEGKILAKNDLAPRIFYENDQCAIELDFSGKEISFFDWVQNMRESAISGEKFWSGIQNKPRSEDERRVYDILARYEKDSPSGIEILLLSIDRTEFYSKREDAVDFIALTAHELRAPLTVIRGYLEILRDSFGENISPNQQEILDRLQVSSQRLSSYIGNILNTSRADQDSFKLELREMRPIDLVREIQNDMTLRAEIFGKKIKFDIPTDLPTVAADRSLIAEVLSNLIDNAIKYSHDCGTVEIFAKSDGDFVQFFVRDHGVGIPANVISHLFKKFYRSRHSSGSAIGFGLGLYISRAIVESCGGKIGVDSEENIGSTFNFTLPIFAKSSQYIDKSKENISFVDSKNNNIVNHASIK